MDSLSKFQQLLRKLFQFDAADVDFGIYRVLNYKRQQIDQFLTERLPQIVNEALQTYAQAQQASLEAKIQETQEKIRSTFGEHALDEHGFLRNYHDTKLGQEYNLLLQQRDQFKVSEDLKTQIYNDLYNFFSRYYEDGDFIAKRRYGRHEAYAIPYGGEEVVLHWATKDQYYIKTGEHLKNYRFVADGYTVVFELRNATTEQNNNKGEKRYFVLASSEPIRWDEPTKTLTIAFEYRPLTDAEQSEYGKTEQQKPQDKLNENAAQAILEKVPDPTLQELLKPKPHDEQSLLQKHLTRFTRKNTSDFFIHKNLRGFLQRELDIFIKSECLRLDELLQKENEDLPRQHILRGRVVREIGYKIIEFLAQIEDFQKRLFEKKKFVIRTEYCITIDRVPEALWDKVLQNDKQIEEWKQLYNLDALLQREGLFGGALTAEFLRKYPSLVVDTRHFSEDFKWRLLAHIDNLDDALDGVLIKSENFQALNLLMEKYRGKVKCIYIDPPYNTGKDDFLYKDGYQHSSWLSMMADRLSRARALLADDGSIYVQVDWNEDPRLNLLMDMIFGGQQFRNKIIWYYTNKIPDTRKRLFTNSTDYILLYAKTEFNRFVPLSEPREVTIKVSKMRKEKGKKIYEKDEQGRGIYIERSERVMDNVWQIPLLHAQPERVCFSTQKPEELVRRVFASSTQDGELVLDFFLGSGTAASVATKMKRKWVGIEVGDFFHAITLPRLKRVLAGENTGISQSVNWTGGGFFKYFYLEQYEDTLNNLELRRKADGQLAFKQFGDEYLLCYMLDFETQGSSCLLDLNQFKDPFAYKLKVQEGNEIQERVVDLIETFNYLLGIQVKRMRQLENNGRLYRAVLGEKDGKIIAIVWRSVVGLEDDPIALQQDRDFIEKTLLPKLLGEGKKPDRIFANGICLVPGVEAIEPEFKRLMWQEGQNG